MALLLAFAQTAAQTDPGDAILVLIDGPALKITLPDIKPLSLPAKVAKDELAKVTQPQGGSKSRDQGKMRLRARLAEPFDRIIFGIAGGVAIR